MPWMLTKLVFPTWLEILSTRIRPVVLVVSAMGFQTLVSELTTCFQCTDRFGAITLLRAEKKTNIEPQ
jgi:hypothetical protein